MFLATTTLPNPDLLPETANTWNAGFSLRLFEDWVFGLDYYNITNDDLLQAALALAYVEQDRVLRIVDYRNLGSEELGSG